LAQIVSEVFLRSGLIEDEFDVSQLTDMVQGFKVAIETTGEAILLELMKAFFFDICEKDGKLVCVKRGGNSVFNLTVDDLAERPGEAIEETESQEPELLVKVHVKAMDPDAGFVETTQSWERRSNLVDAQGQQTISLPVVMHRDTQKQVAEKRGKIAWIGRRGFKFDLPFTRPDLTVTDVGTITDRKGRTQRIRLDEMSEDGGIIHVRQATYERQSAYTSTIEGVYIAPPTDTSPGLIGPTNLVVLNIPPQKDEDDRIGVYVGVRGYTRAWGGAQVRISINGGGFQDGPEISTPANIGFTESVLLEEAAEMPSRQTLDVFLPEAPSSVAYGALLRRNNRAAIVRADGRAEVIQYQTVTTLSPSHYRLGGLIRGRFDTSAAAHASGAVFVLIDSSLVFVEAERWMIGAHMTFQPVSFGTMADGAPLYEFDFTTAESQMEWTVPMIEAYRAPDDTIVLQWQERGRLGTPRTPYPSQYFDGYEVTYSDGADSFTYQIDGREDEYTAAEQTADFGSVPGSLTVTIAAMNTITGAGPATEITL
jgi:hypothetical protein